MGPNVKSKTTFEIIKNGFKALFVPESLLEI